MAEKKLSKEDLDIAVLKTLVEINESLRMMVEFQERLGEAIEMLAKQMGYEFDLIDNEAKG